ncbi:hypothetical protein M5K25_022693 [Dendrobium thyrsiflorum]|uniref:AIG1-type G domain-containing protein n=1 Tax=Dendrobium thyrsiflorum TaxID=117978 RepID=A0ABD0U6L6_DENTH
MPNTLSKAVGDIFEMRFWSAILKICTSVSPSRSKCWAFRKAWSVHLLRDYKRRSCPRLHSPEELKPPKTMEADSINDWELTTASNLVNIVVVGKAGNGKSATGNSILGREAFFSKLSPSGVTCTSELQGTILNDGHIVNVIDTPGLFDFSIDSDVISGEIVKCIDLAKDGIHAVLMVLSIRSRFTREEQAAVESMKTLFGDEIVNYMIIVFTGGDSLESKQNSLEDYISLCPEPLRNLIQLCNNRVIVFDNATVGLRKDPAGGLEHKGSTTRVESSPTRLEDKLEKEKKTRSTATKDMIKREGQVNKLLSLVESVISDNGGKPYLDKIFAELKKGDLLRHQKVKEARATKGLSKEELSEVMEENIKSHNDQLKHVTEMMELQNTLMTVQLGQGARIQLANAIINTGNSGATIQFGSVDFPAVVARTAATSAYDTDSERPARRPHSIETSARHAHLSAPRATTAQDPRRRISVFERLSQSATTQRVVTGGKISVVTANTTNLPTGLSAPREYDPETSSSGGRLTRRQRRKRNAELRAQQQFSTHPSNVPAEVLEATILTQNGFSNLKWVKRNSSTGELKKSFWEQRREVPTSPKKKEPESLSARVYRVLKTVKERGLTKRKTQRPMTVEDRRAPPRERLSITTRIKERRYTPRGEHRGVTPEHWVQGSTAERSRHKGKQMWRPRSHRDEERKEKEIHLGVTSGVASRRSAPNSRDRRRWVQKKTHDDACYNGRHLGESSRGSCRSITPSKEEVNFDRSPRVEEILLPNQEPEIQWRRRSEIRLLEEENMEEDVENMEELEGEEELNDTINMEVVYMARHINVDNGADYDEGEDDGDWQPHPQQEYPHQHEAGSIADGGDRSQGEQEADEVEENHSDDENITLANIRRQMRRQMRAKDREISQLNEKMTEMMAQMTAMMRMMQRTAVVGAIPNPPADPPNL